MSVTIHVGDVRDVLATMADASVDLVLTSPPFLALRSYLPADHPDKAREIGSEATPAAFLGTLLDLTEEWGRVLTPHGSICVELGDTYSGSGGAGGDYADGGLRDGQEAFIGSGRTAAGSKHGADPRRKGTSSRGTGGADWPLPKSLSMIPTLYAASLAYGRNLLDPDHTIDPWRVRNLVVWVRPNPPVGALGDKFRPASSYLTVACKARDRWFDLDAVRTPHTVTNGGPLRGRAAQPEGTNSDAGSTWAEGERLSLNPAGAPPLDWWQITTGGYPGSHYATWPGELCERPIDAMCPRRVCRTCGTPSRREVEPSERYASRGSSGKDFRGERGYEAGGTMTAGHDGWPKGLNGAEYVTTGWSTCGCPGTDGVRLDGFHTGDGWRPGVVLDPFSGSGTTCETAAGRSRDAIGIDLDPRNLALVERRLGWLLTDVVDHRGQGAA